MKILIHFAILVFLSGCFTVKTTTYKELSEEAKEYAKPLKIDIKSYSEQEQGIYSINPNELLALFENSNKSHKLIILNNGTCEWFQPVVKDIYNWSSENIEIFTISGHDWGLIEYYNEYFNDNKYLNKIYLVDAVHYSELNGWYDNKTHRMRIDQFLLDLLAITDTTKIENIKSREYAPDAIVFDSNNKITEIYDNTGFESNEAALENHKRFLKYIEKL